MPPLTAFVGDIEQGGFPTPARSISEGATAADVATLLGISEDGAVALVADGRLGEGGDLSSLPRCYVEWLCERIWRAALPTSADAGGVPLIDAVTATDVGPALWPVVVAALLDGRLNAYRPRGALGEPVLAALVVSSMEIVADLAPAPDAEAPFIWTPSPRP